VNTRTEELNPLKRKGDGQGDRLKRTGVGLEPRTNDKGMTKFQNDKAGSGEVSQEVSQPLNLYQQFLGQD
jgi:hypothetical protein